MKTDKIMTLFFLLVLACFLSLGCDQLRGEDGVDGLGTPGPPGDDGPPGIPCQDGPPCVNNEDLLGGITRDKLSSGFTVDDLITPLSVSGGDTGNIGLYTVDTVNIAPNAFTALWVAEPNLQLGNSLTFSEFIDPQTSSPTWQDIPDMLLNINASDPALGGNQSIMFEGSFIFTGDLSILENAGLGLFIDDVPVKTVTFQSTYVAVIVNTGGIGIGWGYPLTQRIIIRNGSLPTGNHNVKVKIYIEGDVEVKSFSSGIGSRTLVVRDFSR